MNIVAISESKTERRFRCRRINQLTTSTFAHVTALRFAITSHSAIIFAPVRQMFWPIPAEEAACGTICS
jgi:hypothetical protein